MGEQFGHVVVDAALNPEVVQSSAHLRDGRNRFVGKAHLGLGMLESELIQRNRQGQLLTPPFNNQGLVNSQVAVIAAERVQGSPHL